ncbi:MAG TPA: hypothetical protein VF426_04355, partial [Marmoricola sp.]
MTTDRPEQTDGPGELGALFDDLEQQWLGLDLEERSAAAAELGVATYADVTVSGRVHASIGRTLSVTCLGGHRVVGALQRAGADFVVVGGWVVATAAI